MYIEQMHPASFIMALSVVRPTRNVSWAFKCSTFNVQLLQVSSKFNFLGWSSLDSFFSEFRFFFPLFNMHTFYVLTISFQYT